VKAKKRVVKRKTDMRKVTVSIPEELYCHIKQMAKQEIRTIGQQTRLFIEIGVEVVAQQSQHRDAEQQESQECESCIGFRVDQSGDDED
jgi:hypothetical protein